MTHFGLPLQVNNAKQSDPAPTRLRLGASYEVLHHFHVDPELALRAQLGVVAGTSADVGAHASVGAEFSAGDAVFLRAGYAGGHGLGSGGAVGIGFDYQRFRLGLAKSFTGSSFEADEQPVQVTFAIRF